MQFSALLIAASTFLLTLAAPIVERNASTGPICSNSGQTVFSCCNAVGPASSIAQLGPLLGFLPLENLNAIVGFGCITSVVSCNPSQKAACCSGNHVTQGLIVIDLSCSNFV